MMDTSFLSMRIPKILMSTADEYGNVCRLMSKADEEDNGALTLTHTVRHRSSSALLCVCVRGRAPLPSSSAFLMRIPKICTQIRREDSGDMHTHICTHSL